MVLIFLFGPVDEGVSKRQDVCPKSKYPKVSGEYSKHSKRALVLWCPGFVALKRHLKEEVACAI
jgi:hypothetical protein